jgi:hypothetical protein
MLYTHIIGVQRLSGEGAGALMMTEWGQLSHHHQNSPVSHLFYAQTLLCIILLRAHFLVYFSRDHPNASSPPVAIVANFVLRFA